MYDEIDNVNIENFGTRLLKCENWGYVRLAIIDYLQPWDRSKIYANSMKVMIYREEDISTVDPEHYQKRFSELVVLGHFVKCVNGDAILPFPSFNFCSAWCLHAYARTSVTWPIMESYFRQTTAEKHTGYGRIWSNIV